MIHLENQKTLSMLGLMIKAGKLISGEELVINNVRANKVELVLLATDASDNTKKKVNDKCKTYNTKVLCLFTSDEMSNAIGKDNRKVLGVLDKGFAKGFLSKLEK